LGGLGQTRPVSAGVLGGLMFCLLGLPLTTGFIGKFLLFLSAFDAPTSGAMRNMTRILAVIAAGNAAIGAVYYLRVVAGMYLRAPLRAGRPAQGSPALFAGLLCALATVVLGVYSNPLVEAARRAVPIADDQPRSAVVDGPVR